MDCPTLEVFVVKEKTIERAILDYLTARSIFCFKVNNTGIWDPHRKVFRLAKSQYIIKGVADIIGIFGGRMLAIEVKTPQRRRALSEAQKAFLDTVRLQGGISILATSIEDVANALEEYEV